MTRDEFLTGFKAGKRHVMLGEWEGYPREPAMLLPIDDVDLPCDPHYDMLVVMVDIPDGIDDDGLRELSLDQIEGWVD